MGSRRGRPTMYSSYSYGGASYGGGSSYSGSSYSYGGSYASPSYGPTAQTSRYRDMVSNMYGGLPTPNSGYSSKYTSQYSPSNSYSVYSTRGTTLPPPTRGASIPPPMFERAARTRTVFRTCEGDDNSNRHIRLKSPSIPRERTRDELIDSIVHARTREHRAMPGFKSATDFDERRSLRVDCDKVFNGIIIGNGETICNITYLKNIGVTHVLNTATAHVVVNPAKYPSYGIQYHGFHVDDLPEDNMTATKALELIRQNRSIRPNAGFLQQLADLEN